MRPASADEPLGPRWPAPSGLAFDLGLHSHRPGSAAIPMTRLVRVRVGVSRVRVRLRLRIRLRLRLRIRIRIRIRAQGGCRC